MVQPAASAEVPCAVSIRVAGTVRFDIYEGRKRGSTGRQTLLSEALSYRDVMSQGDRERLLMDAIPKALLLWRLSIIEEVLLSGFQLELYVQDEKSFVYWQLSQVILEHLSILDSLERVIPKSRCTRKVTMSVLRSFRSLNRHRSIWRTYLCTLISHFLSVTLHRNVHGETLENPTLNLGHLWTIFDIAYASSVTSSSRAPGPQLRTAIQMGVSARVREATSSGRDPGSLVVR